MALPALAVPATQEGATAIANNRATIDDECFAESFFKTSAGGPFLTADGQGAFEFFSGSKGEGAIYWEPGAARAFRVYGTTLNLWSSLNFENGTGYPRNDQGWIDCDYISTLPTDVNFGGVVDITYSGGAGTGFVHGDIRDSWLAAGSQVLGQGHGYPRSNEMTISSGSEFACPAGHILQDFYAGPAPETAPGAWLACWDPATRNVSWSYWVSNDEGGVEYEGEDSQGEGEPDYVYDGDSDGEGDEYNP